MSRKIKLFALTGVLISFFQQNCFAVGASAFSTQFVGAKAMGQGNAFVAQADDPTAVYFNPAGLPQLEGTQVSLGGTFLLPFVNRTGAGVPEDQMKRSVSVIPNLYLTGSLPAKFLADDKISLGLGFTSPYGLTTEWAPTSSVRYTTTVSKFQMLNTNPTIAAKILPTLSVGLGVDYVSLFNVEAESQTNQDYANAYDGSPDGTSNMTGNGDGWGYNIGLMYKPAEKHSFGASYRSQVHIGVTGDLNLTNLSDSTRSNYNFPPGSSSYSTSVKTDVTLPSSVLLGYAFHPNQKWTLLADYEWTQWSVFKTQDVTINESDPGRLAFLTGDPSSNVSSTARNWEDVSSIGLGANYKLNDKWQYRGGYGFFEKAVPNSTYSPDVPDASMHLLTAGLTRSWSHLVFDVALNGWFYTPQDINNNVGEATDSSVDGTYKTFVPALAFNLTYKFGK